MSASEIRFLPNLNANKQAIIAIDILKIRQLLLHYLDAEFLSQNGGIRKIKNAIYIHKEDTGILFKHTDFRDESSIMTQARILVIQQVFTAANYEYAIRQDGSIQPEIKLTGILNTYAMNPGEDTHGRGTQVYPVFMADAVASDVPVSSPENFYGNAFSARKTKFSTTAKSITDHNSSSLSWDG
ncbi:peroxisomal copper amine oxidase [Fusarium graminearum]|nr:peroxisomal copper amine oxidase [Fusarium graminearum]